MIQLDEEDLLSQIDYAMSIQDLSSSSEAQGILYGLGLARSMILQTKPITTRWIDGSNAWYIKCEHCQTSFRMSEFKHEKYNYCPICGAKVIKNN